MKWTSWFADGLFLLTVVGIPLWGWYRKLNVFERFVVGAKDGVHVILQIFPFLLGMLVAIGMLRASGAFATITQWIGPALLQIGFPPDLLPLVLVRPFSGSASNGVLADLIQNHGADSFISLTGATIMGSTETTFYVLAIYFGSVGITRTRHAIATGLSADLAGVIASLLVCRWLLLT
jgi:spore maturation protein B